MRIGLVLGLAGLMAVAMAQSQPPRETQQRLDALRDLIQYRLVQLSDHYWHEGHHYKTMALLFVLIEYDPHDVESYASLGWLLDSYGHTARGFQVYERGIRANPNRYDLYFEAGFWYSEKGDYNRARAYLEKAVSFPECAHLRLENTGTYLREDGRPEALLGSLAESERDRPDRRRRRPEHDARAQETGAAERTRTKAVVVRDDIAYRSGHLGTAGTGHYHHSWM
jgi:tetratricopeptide (TPR) repeat protein